MDVYSDWIDACDAVAKDADGGTMAPTVRLGRLEEESDGGIERDDAADLLDDEIGEAEYAD